MMGGMAGYGRPMYGGSSMGSMGSRGPMVMGDAGREFFAPKAPQAEPVQRNALTRLATLAGQVPACERPEPGQPVCELTGHSYLDKIGAYGDSGIAMVEKFAKVLSTLCVSARASSVSPRMARQLRSVALAVVAWAFGRAAQAAGRRRRAREGAGKLLQAAPLALTFAPVLR